MRFSKTINVVGCHCGGEVCDVITGGVIHIPGSSTLEKVRYLWDQKDDLRQFLMQEPRGTVNRCMNLITAPSDPQADLGFIIMEADEYPPMSGANTIATATVAIETGIIPMQPETTVVLDTAAGLVTAHAICDLEVGKVKSVTFDNVPAFVFGLDILVNVPELGTIKVDIAWGGMIYCLVDANSINLDISSANGKEIVRIGEIVKKAVREQHDFVHPEFPEFRGVSIVQFTTPIQQIDGIKTAYNAVVVSPGRLDRSPCGTGTCARLAMMHARGLLEVGESFHHRSPIHSQFIAHIKGTTQVGPYKAIYPAVSGTAWISGFHQYVLDPTDPFPTGFRIGDLWPSDSSKLGKFGEKSG